MVGSALPTRLARTMTRAVTSTFASFIETRSSARASRLVRRAARTCGRMARMVVLVGGPGSGKTHLLHATANEVRRLSAADIVYTTAADLARELIADLRAIERPGRVR